VVCPTGITEDRRGDGRMKIAGFLARPKRGHKNKTSELDADIHLNHKGLPRGGMQSQPRADLRSTFSAYSA